MIYRYVSKLFLSSFSNENSPATQSILANIEHPYFKGNELHRTSAGTGAIAAFTPDNKHYLLGIVHGRLMFHDVTDGTKRWKIRLSE